MQQVVIVGGGISGLATARYLTDLAGEAGLKTTGPSLDLRITLLEAEDRLGGNIRTDRFGDYLVEQGPDGFLDNQPKTLELARRVGLSDRILPASDAMSRRFILRNGKLREVPGKPQAFLTSRILSLSGKLRVLCEPFSRSSREDDQTVYAFARRHIGEEAARILVDAMVSGIFAGDIEKLSLKSAFPTMHDMESAHGTLTRAMFAKMREARMSGKKTGSPMGPGGRLTSFTGGMEELISALAGSLPEETIWKAHPVTAVSVEDAEGQSMWRISVETRRVTPHILADAVILALPARRSAEIVKKTDENLARILSEIPYAPLVVLATAYHSRDIPFPPDGFGFLAPRNQGLRILGSLWTSSIYGESRAPGGQALLRNMLGGAHDPDVLKLDDQELSKLVKEDLRQAMGITADPVQTWIYRHDLGIPQYNAGHSRRLEELEKIAEHRPGLFMTGNSFRGIGVNQCIVDAETTALKVMAHLQRQADRSLASTKANPAL
ncbi:MAG: protoporphyrinogen oxidase [Armatimonadetes bacterium]|nr:protoporphyrinogen oxidase [Armatimonadota bacterium]